jgi:hypothetical protein
LRGRLPTWVVRMRSRLVVMWRNTSLRPSTRPLEFCEQGGTVFEAAFG